MNERLKLLRKILKLSQTEFASKLGRTMQTIQNYEYGKTPIDSVTISRICEEFKVSPDWLLTGNGEMFAKEISENSLSEEEKAMLHYYKGLTPNDKKTIQNLISSLSKTDKKII